MQGAFLFTLVTCRIKFNCHKINIMKLKWELKYTRSRVSVWRRVRVFNKIAESAILKLILCAYFLQPLCSGKFSSILNVFQTKNVVIIISCICHKFMSFTYLIKGFIGTFFILSLFTQYCRWYQLRHPQELDKFLQQRNMVYLDEFP